MFKSIIRFLERDYNPSYIWELRRRILLGKRWDSFFSSLKYNRALEKNNAYIPCNNNIATMPKFPHGIGGVMISGGAIIGKDCVIFHQVTIGSNTFVDSKNPGAPVIGDNVFIGAGAKIIGNCKIGDNVRIGANCVITQDIPDNSTVVLQQPNVICHNEARNNSFISWEDYLKNEECVQRR